MYKAEPVMAQMHKCLITLAAVIKYFINFSKNLYDEKSFLYDEKSF
tara:strand:- start:288 stop:425 length:138 start_codon:yes stop_codon:yes gene_type:complete